MKAFFKGLITDVNDRPEPKNILGFIFGLSAVAYLFVSRDTTGFAIVAGTAVGCFTVSTVADYKTDKLNQGK